MADIHLAPPMSSKVHSRTGVMTDALAKFASVVVWSGTDGHADVSTTTTAAKTGVAGVVASHGDPNNFNLHAVGDEVTVVDIGDHPILVIAGTYTRGDKLVTSTTAGHAKVLAAETGNMTIIGEVLEDVVLASPAQISVRLTLTYAKPA